ncbi:MAG: HlyD family secretion protein [Lysobacteraceae bacterium]
MTAPRPLFREEVLQARRDSWLGDISLVQPVPVWILSGMAALAALAVVLFLALATYTRRTTVEGQLVPVAGLATVLSPATGVLSRSGAGEGAHVRTGQTVAVVTVPRSTLASGDTQAALAQRLDQRLRSLDMAQAALRSQAHAQASGLASQLAASRQELAQIEAEIGTRREQVRIAGETLARLRQLQDTRYVSVLQVKQQESAVLEQTSAVQELQRQATQARKAIAGLQQAIRELPAQREADAANFQKEAAQLAQEQIETEARGQLSISAPLDGVVATWFAKPGQAVEAGKPLLSVLPGDGRLEAELLVASQAIGFIEPGDRVLLRYQAYPYQKFGHQAGTVTRISRSALAPDQTGVSGRLVPAGEPYYRVTVALARQRVTAYGKSEQLKPGMLLEADILGEKRRLIEWVFEPLYSLRGKVSG